MPFREVADRQLRGIEPGSSLRGALIDCQSFGLLPCGREAHIFTLRNRAGVTARITNFGASLVSLLAPDRRGLLGDIVLGYTDLLTYVTDTQYMGALIGRYANRIANSTFELDGHGYRLESNQGRHCLHGGREGLSKALWGVRRLHSGDNGATLLLHHSSPHLSSGFPGNLDVEVAFVLDEHDSLTITMRARTDRATVVSLTYHPYFNLTGDGGCSDILAHELQISSDCMLPLDELMIPTGDIHYVEGTPFDFRHATPIGQRIFDKDTQLCRAGGYDHYWIAKRSTSCTSPRARVHDPQSGRLLEVNFSAPGLQFYSGNCLDGTGLGKGGIALRPRTGLCLEPQAFPDAPNQSAFPSTQLKASEEYASTISFHVGVLS